MKKIILAFLIVISCTTVNADPYHFHDINDIEYKEISERILNLYAKKVALEGQYKRIPHKINKIDRELEGLIKRAEEIEKVEKE